MGKVERGTCSAAGFGPQAMHVNHGIRHVRLDAHAFCGFESPSRPSQLIKPPARSPVRDKDSDVILPREGRWAAGEGGNYHCGSGSWEMGLMGQTEIVQRDQRNE